MTLNPPSVADCIKAAPAWSDLLATMNNNERLLRDVLNLMNQEAPRLGRAFRNALDSQNMKEARRAVHTLKSNCRQFELKAFAEFAQDLEEMSRTADVEQMKQFAPAIEQIGNAVADWIEGLLESH